MSWDENASSGACFFGRTHHGHTTDTPRTHHGHTKIAPVEVGGPVHNYNLRHSADRAKQQASEQALQNPVGLARDVVVVLPADEARSQLSQIKLLGVDSRSPEVVCVFCSV
jgi:hypothetical protein